MSSITHLRTLDQLNKLIVQHKNSILVIDFHATWCGPCHAIADFYNSLATNYPSLTFTKCDVDQAQEIAKQFQVTAMPTFLFLKSGVKVDQVRGADRSSLERLVKKYAAMSSGGASAGQSWSGEGHRLGGPGPATANSSTGPSVVHSLSANSVLDYWNALAGQTKLGVALVAGYLILLYLS